MEKAVQPLVLSSARYEIVTGFIATIVGGLGVPFYIEATSKSGWKDEASSIVANVLSIILFTKGSLDYLYDLIQKKEYGKATGVVITAAVLYSPQVLIVWMETNKPLFGMNLFDTKLFSAVATGLSGAFTAAYAVAQLPRMLHSAKAALEAQFCSQATLEQKAEKINVLANLNALINRVRVSNRNVALNISADFTRQNLLDLAVTMAKTAPQPCVENAGSLPVVANRALGSVFALLLLYGTLFSYGCGTEKSLIDDFKLTSMSAFFLSIALLSFQYLLNFTGGFGVASGIVDSVGLTNFGRIMPNEDKLGGLLGMTLTVLAPFLGMFSASFSGAPTKEFAQTCHSSVLSPVLFPGFDVIADYSSRFFNAIFAAKFFYFVHTQSVKRFGSEQDRNFLFILNQLLALEATVKNTPAEKVDELFASESVVDNAYIAPRVAADDDAAADDDSVSAVKVRPLVNTDVPVVTAGWLKLSREDFGNHFFRATPQQDDIRDDQSQISMPFDRTAAEI